jgi:predicted nucleic acid-binding protein
MSKRINTMIDEDTWGFLGRVPAGEGSRAINEALRAWVIRRRRSDAVREMAGLRVQLPKITTAELTRWIREDREHDHLMPVPLVVPDASVLLRWVLPSDDEPYADKVLLLRAAIQDEAVHVLLPGLWLFEVGNTIARRFPTHASPWLSARMKFGLEEASPSQVWLARALELTRRYEVSFYDAAYHALALIHKGLFVTADRGYVDRVMEAGSIIALSEWQPPFIPTRRRKRGWTS